MWYKSVSDSLYSVVNGLVASTKLTAVYNYDIKEATTFPYAIITTKDWEENILDTQSNEIEYSFIIRVIHQSNDIANVEPVMRQLCDDIMWELRKQANQTLSWTIKRLAPFSVTWWWADWQFPTRVFDIQVQVLDIQNIV